MSVCSSLASEKSSSSPTRASGWPSRSAASGSRPWSRTWRTSARVSKEQQYLILSLLASDYEALEMSDKKLPQHMYVDWVRVYK